MNGFRKKCKKTYVFGPNGQKGPFLNFPKKMRKSHFLPTPKTRLSTKNYKILMNGLRQKIRKTSIFGHFGAKWPILDSFGQNGQKGIFIKKVVGTI